MQQRPVEPSLWLSGKVGEHKADRLLLGADEHTNVGPSQEMRGLRTAVRLIEEVAGELGVPPERVVCFGTSIAASLAALTGSPTERERSFSGLPRSPTGPCWALGPRRSGEPDAGR